MINIKILGTGCASCKSTQRLVEEVIAAKGVQAQVEKVEDIPSIMQYGVMRTPGVVIDGKVVHAGGVPNRAMVESWISA
ncbi:MULTISPECIES: thioredoxin family protein [Thiomonas]|jgi:small redox-active disulfide protein 2|uniref:thioredoxin family protein n=1 Tax=Thiomonas TaxID=32012 RepID=UPI0004DBA264|nr:MULTISPECIES: thioredoxin family protein [Thiomonas]CQR43027.1 Thiol-disulfide isomerase and thioredoxins family protein [Thiomonas sp. CB3]MDD5001694.1 thioredoxin family protein [Thiomonas arsenitoxydans]CDW93657.1 Thiol-disulfide isomerase and thioredoxins family protein [Thiomonas sp. CB2]CQR45686.1 Thiol-disulfide isomerase and thioredoxins family protein [Thiomonas sp. CB3]VDY04917.1 Thiol-disulfide isomerase and thioredoxins family protein [Thiomonas sp. Bio17B3]